MNEEQNASLHVPETQTSFSPSPKESTAKAIVKEIVIFALIAFCIVLPFRMFVAEPYVVSGSSMDPTFTTGDYLIVDKLSYEIGEPKRNSVVVFKFPTETSRNLIKRIIGLPFDTVKMEGTKVTITNKEHPEGFVLPQQYISFSSPASFTVTLGPKEYFVMGDNRPVSYDSRSWGVLPRSDILGRPIIRLLPLSEIKILPGDYSGK